MTQQEFFNRYTYSVKTDRIGGGGFGTVYRATDKVLHRKVAIKVSEVKIIGDKEFSLKSEFDAVGKLPPHQNIAHYEELYSFESPQGVFDYAIMQFYEDGNLKNLIDKGKLTYEQKEKIATGILDGIAFLHKNKVVHRDLKPANILIYREGDDYIPLITDFGLSKGVEEMSKSGFTNSIAGGSPGYMSPEQVKGGRMQLNTDLWSYGVIVYELFSGKRLFQSTSQSSSTSEVQDMILHKDISGEIASLPSKWRMVAERCLERDNANRAKSADDLYGIIRFDDQTNIEISEEITILEEDPKPKPEPKPKPKPKPEPTPKPKKNLTWLWVLLGIVVLGGAVFGLLRMQSYKPSGVINGHEYVDLGLPSGLLWATCNVGANKSEDYGNYYAWGETTTKGTYNWSTYKWCRGSYDNQTKYCTESKYGTVDNRKVLEMTDDAARANWGGSWRMPTCDELNELETKCTWTWTTQGGKNGYRVAGPNGKSIFLPAAGYYLESSLNGAGSNGRYWSSSLYASSPHLAYYLSFDSGYVGMYDYYRYYGRSVRPVCSPQN